MNIEAMKRHLAKPTEIDFGEDKLLMVPLTVDDLPELMDLQGRMASAVKGDILSIDKQMTASAIELLRKSIASANEITDMKLINEFIASNFLTLLPKLFEINSLTSERDKRKQQQIERIKKKIGNGAVPDSSSD